MVEETLQKYPAVHRFAVDEEDAYARHAPAAQGKQSVAAW